MADWPKESPEQRQIRLLRGLDETGIADWAPEERQDLRPTVQDYRERQAAKKASEAKRKELSNSLKLRLQIASLIIALLAISGSFAGAWLANHNSSPVVVVQSSPAPTPAHSPTPAP